MFVKCHVECHKAVGCGNTFYLSVLLGYSFCAVRAIVFFHMQGQLISVIFAIWALQVQLRESRASWYLDTQRK